jgi:hypothetical protein
MLYTFNISTAASYVIGTLNGIEDVTTVRNFLINKYLQYFLYWVGVSKEVMF